MKLFGIGVISSLLLAFTMNSRVEAFVFPDIKLDEDAPAYLFLDGVPFTFGKRGETTNGLYTIRDTVVPPGQGAPPHIHQMEDEWFYVVSGNIQIMIGDNIYDDASLIPGVNAPRDTLRAINAPAGTLIYGPRYRIHGVRNVTNEDARLRLVWNPAGFEDIFKQPGMISVPDLSNVPPAPPNYNLLYGQAAATRGVVSSTFYEQFGEIVLDDSVFNQDNRADDLLQILAAGSQQVPEPSVISGVIVFGATGAVSVWKRKSKSVRKVG